MHRISQLKRLLLRSTLLVSSLGAFTSSPSSALGETAVDSDAIKRAREQFGQALSLQTGGDWAGALALLKEVAAVKPTPQVRFNIAICEDRLGRLVAALGDYELAATDAQAEHAEQVAEEVDSRLEALKARVPRVVVQRGVGADAATISLDGVSLGDSVLNKPMLADPGPHVVEAKAAGFRPFKQSFRVAEQQTATIVVKLEAEPVAPDAPLAAAGPHASSHGTRSAGFVVGSLGALSLIGSGVFFYLRHDSIVNLDKQCGSDRQACPESARTAIDHGQLYTTLADVGLAVGAVGLGVGAALVIAGSSPERASVSIAPGAVGANAGASVLGRF